MVHMSFSRLLKTGCNNVVLTGLLLNVKNSEPYCLARISPQSGVKMLNNIVSIVNNHEQCWPHNIVRFCFQQDLIFGRVVSSFVHLVFQLVLSNIDNCIKMLKIKSGILGGNVVLMPSNWW